MSIATSSSFQAALDRPKPAQKPVPVHQDARFKTTNLQIFPSLHPLSNFYRDKTQVTPKPAFLTPKPSVSQPIKKVKLNDKTGAIVCNAEFSTKPVNEKKILNQALKCDDEGFRVPRLPSRFYINNKNQGEVEPKQIEQAEMLPIQEVPMISSFCEPLIMPENILKNTKASQKQQKNTVKSVPKRNSQKAVSVRVPEADVQEKQIFTQQDMLFALINRSLEQAAIYNNLDFLSIQLRESVPHLFKICQQNQAMLSHMRRSYIKPINVLEGMNMQQDQDKHRRNVIQQGNIKQEIEIEC